MKTKLIGICDRDLFMRSGNLAFKAGKEYEFYDTLRAKKSELGEAHLLGSWSMHFTFKYRQEFEEGDYVATSSGSIFIYKCMDEDRLVGYVFLGGLDSGYYNLNISPACSYDNIPTLATPEQVKKLNDFLASKGKRWNAQTKKLEDLVFEPKEGDVVINEYGSVFIFKGENRNGACDYYAGVYKDIFYTQSNTGFNKGSLRLATYEERCKFFEILVKEGYKWDSRKLKLTKKGLNPEDMKKGEFYKVNIGDNNDWLIFFDKLNKGRVTAIMSHCLHTRDFYDTRSFPARWITKIIPATPEEIDKSKARAEEYGYVLKNGNLIQTFDSWVNHLKSSYSKDYLNNKVEQLKTVIK